MRSRCAIERSRAEAGVDVLAQLQVTGDPDRRMYQPTRTNQLQQTKQTKYEYQTNWTLVLVAVHLVESVCWRRSVGWSKMASCHLTGADKRKCQCNYYKAMQVAVWKRQCSGEMSIQPVHLQKQSFTSNFKSFHSKKHANLGLSPWHAPWTHCPPCGLCTWCRPLTLRSWRAGWRRAPTSASTT